MSTTPERTNTLAESDGVSVYSYANQTWRTAALTVLADYIAARVPNPFALNERTVEAIANDQTFDVWEDGKADKNTLLIAAYTGTLRTGTTFRFPGTGQRRDGQRITLTAEQDYPNVTLDGNGATLNGVPGSISAGSVYTYHYSGFSH